MFSQDDHLCKYIYYPEQLHRLTTYLCNNERICFLKTITFVNIYTYIRVVDIILYPHLKKCLIHITNLGTHTGFIFKL